MSDLKQRLNELNDELVEQNSTESHEAKEKTSERLKLSERLKEAAGKQSAEQKPQSSLSEYDLKAKIRGSEFYQIGKKTTVCLLHMENGFEVVGTSAPVDARNFNAEIGRGLAYEDAVSKLWALEGYLLQEALQQVIPDYEA